MWVLANSLWRILEWIVISFSRDLPNPGIVPGSPALQADALLSKPPGKHASVQFSSVAQLCPTLCDPMNCSRPGLPVHHHLPEFTLTHIHRVHDAIQPSHPLSSPSPPAHNPSQHQSLFQWVNSSHEVSKVLELQLFCGHIYKYTLPTKEYLQGLPFGIHLALVCS